MGRFFETDVLESNFGGIMKTDFKSLAEAYKKGCLGKEDRKRIRDFIDLESAENKLRNYTTKSGETIDLLAIKDDLKPKERSNEERQMEFKFRKGF